MPNWTRFRLIISQEMTGISGALCFFFHQFESKRLLTACLSCDISLPSLGLQLCENNHTIHVAVRLLPKPGWPHFLPLSLAPAFPFLRLPPFFFLPFSRSPSLRPRTQHFPTECSAEGWAIVSCYRETGREEEAGWLPGCQLDFYVSVRKSRGDISDDDGGIVYPRDWLQLEKYRFCYISQTVAPK